MRLAVITDEINTDLERAARVAVAAARGRSAGLRL
jgi:hypothetical protein